MLRRRIDGDSTCRFDENQIKLCVVDHHLSFGTSVVGKTTSVVERLESPDPHLSDEFPT